MFVKFPSERYRKFLQRDTLTLKLREEVRKVVTDRERE